MHIFVFIAFVISFLCTLLITPFIIRLANRFGLVDNPSKRHHPAHTHTGIVPRAGGIGILLGILIPLLFFITPSNQIAGIMAGAVTLVAVGVCDDKKDISPYIRFLVNCLAAVMVIVSGITIPYITNPSGGIINLDGYELTLPVLGISHVYPLPFLITLLWIVWTTNIVGWSGGVDGQLPGFVSISAVVIGLLSLRYALNDPSQIQVTYLSFLTAGAYMGFLPWNYFPQKIMPGYGGKSLAGFMLAVLSILAFSKLGTAMFVLAMPMIDAFIIFIKRLFTGRSPVWATSGHLHHHLLKVGWSKRRIAFFYWLITACAGIAALTLSSKQKVYTAVLIVVLISGFIIWMSYLKKLPFDGENEE